MGSLNQWTGIGNLGRDAELRYTPGGDAVATFSIACSETWKDRGGEKQERTEWVRVVLWGKQAESLNEYLTKGKQVAVVGRLQTRKWQDKDGNDRHTTEVKADRVVLLGGGGRRREAGDETAATPEQAPASAPTELSDDDIPF